MHVNDLFPGIKVKVTEGRYKGDVGKVISYEKNSRGETKVEVRISIEWYNRYSREGKPPPEKYHSEGKAIISWMNPANLELVKLPKVVEVRGSRRLLMIKENPK